MMLRTVAVRTGGGAAQVPRGAEPFGQAGNRGGAVECFEGHAIVSWRMGAGRNAARFVDKQKIAARRTIRRRQRFAAAAGGDAVNLRDELVGLGLEVGTVGVVEGVVGGLHGELTQLQGSAGQDALNFPGRIDNQIIELYSGVISSERKLPKGITERYADLKPQVEKLLTAATKVLTTDVAAFNAVSGAANAGTITIK